MAGFRDQQHAGRTPVYTVASRKVGYMCGDCYTDLNGKVIARILRYKVELPASTSSVSGSHIVTPDPTYEG